MDSKVPTITPLQKINYDMKIDLITLGDQNSGKTSLLSKFTNSFISQAQTATVGLDFRVKNVEIDGKTMRMVVWDTAGQERFRTMTMQYFNKADCVMFVYDTSS